MRTWYWRTTGWFGQVTATGQARVRVPGVEVDVLVAELGDTEPDVRAAVDQAYLAKYGDARRLDGRGNDHRCGGSHDSAASPSLGGGRACCFVCEAVNGVEDVLGLFEVRQVPGVGDRLEAGVWE